MPHPDETTDATIPDALEAPTVSPTDPAPQPMQAEHVEGMLDAELEATIARMVFSGEFHTEQGPRAPLSTKAYLDAETRKRMADIGALHAVPGLRFGVLHLPNGIQLEVDAGRSRPGGSAFEKAVVSSKHVAALKQLLRRALVPGAFDAAGTPAPEIVEPLDAGMEERIARMVYTGAFVGKDGPVRPLGTKAYLNDRTHRLLASSIETREGSAYGIIRLVSGVELEVDRGRRRAEGEPTEDMIVAPQHLFAVKQLLRKVMRDADAQD